MGKMKYMGVAGGGAVYGLGFAGALIYYLQHTITILRII